MDKSTSQKRPETRLCILFAYLNTGDESALFAFKPGFQFKTVSGLFMWLCPFICVFMYIFTVAFLDGETILKENLREV